MIHPSVYVTLLRKIGYCIFFFNVTATTYIYTLSLHDALPISGIALTVRTTSGRWAFDQFKLASPIIGTVFRKRSEEHTSELQSRVDLVCRLLLEKKNLGRIVG